MAEDKIEQVEEEEPSKQRRWKGKINRANVEKASRLDKFRRAGGTTPGCEDDVVAVGELLVREGLLEHAGDGAFDQTMIDALSEFGPLEKLADKHDFLLVGGPE